MNIVAIRTDTENTHLIYIVDGEVIREDAWTAGRQLASTLLGHIDMLLAGCGTDISSVDGIVVYEGPGSFTGLRIGITVANTIAYSLSVPIVGVSGDDWLVDGLELLNRGDGKSLVFPEYGAEAHITM